MRLWWCDFDVFDAEILACFPSNSGLVQRMSIEDTRIAAEPAVKKLERLPYLAGDCLRSISLPSDIACPGLSVVSDVPFQRYPQAF